MSDTCIIQPFWAVSSDRLAVLPPGQMSADSVTSSQGDAKGPSDSFLADVKETFGAEMSNQLILAIRRYEKDDNYESLITTAVGLLTQKDDNLVLLESKNV